MAHHQGLLLIYLSTTLYFLNTLAQITQTTVVSLTSTTTIHATATDYTNACNNFVGACVVYGADNAAYTTTVYAANPTSSPATTQFVTSTTVVQATSTVTDGSACNGFSGACVVYGTDGAAQYTTTAYAASQSVGNSGGYIANSEGGSNQGVIGAGNATPAWTWLSSLGMLLAGGVFWM